ncbi:MAG: hypothetical protein KC549_08420, partial [Myxococcales bacterium]|nr:hypothetical protein [Myxococcales bacterium]
MRGALWLWPWLLVGFAPPFGPDQGAEEDARLAAGEAVRLLVSYDHPPGPSEVARVEALGGRVTHRWTGVVHALAADLTRSQAEALAAADPGVVFIEPSRPTSATVAYAARQTGQRGAVDPEPNRDFTGAGQVVAVVDAGFDASHVDFEGRLRAWADFVGASVDRGGDLYPRATDAQGHGTAVGGMMAGRGLGAPAGAVPISFHAGFHPQAGWCRDAPLPLSPRAGGRVGVRLQPALGAARYTLSHRHYVDGGRSPGAANVEVGAFAGQGAARFELDVAA